MTVAHQASLSMGFPRQEYWSELPFPSLGDLPNPGIELESPELAGRFFTTEPPESELLIFLSTKTILCIYSLYTFWGGRGSGEAWQKLMLECLWRQM